MSWKQKAKENWKGGAAGALLAVGLGLGLLLLNVKLGETLVHLSYNIPFLTRPTVRPDEVVLVYLDDASFHDLEQPYFGPWDRGLYAQLLERLTTEHARAVSFDIMFSDRNQQHPEGDARFAQAIKANGKVVLAAEYKPDELNPKEGGIIVPPLALFFDAAASWGMEQLLMDQDFVVRQHLHAPPNIKDDDNNRSMTWELAKVAGSPFTQDNKLSHMERWLNYYGPPGFLPSIGFRYALQTNGYCPQGFFSNKVVLVGAYLQTYGAGERKDEFRTPYTLGNSFGPGVDVQATQLLNLLRGDWLTRPSRSFEIVVILLAGLLAGYGLALFRPFPAAGVAVALALLVTVIAHAIFWEERIWFPWMIIVAAQIPVALAWSVVFNSMQLYVQNKLYQQSLQMYLSPKLVKKFSSDRELLKPGAKKQLLTVLFSDIASFTSISEGMDSDHLARSMNVYFQSAVAQCIHATDGTIVKYIGDAIFAFWNAPDDQIDHAMRACEAALRFRDQPPQYMNEQLLVTRIGLHTGVANVGNFGSTARVDYTAIGENINLASRMEGLNKYLGTDVLITAETEEGIRGRLLTRFLGRFQLKGFERAVGVYELVGQVDRTEVVRPLHEAFAQALKLFQGRDFVAAEAALRRVLEIAPKDGPAKFYLKHIAELGEHPLPEDWKGEVELKEK